MKTRIINIIAACLLLAIGANAQQAPLYENRVYKWLPDRIEQGKFTAISQSPERITTNFVSQYGNEDKTRKEWRLKNQILPYPQLSTPLPLEASIYNMSLDEMLNQIEADSTLRTGQDWGGVWTRDISYSIMLSMSYLQPEVSKKSLMVKINKLGKIVQDTGTGGSWPCSSDRVVWVGAAWDLYKATGDKEWIKDIYPVIKRTFEDDFKTIYDKETGLVLGESSFIDWRAQSYPTWMQPADIYQSKCLGTNAIHYQALNIMSRMAEILGFKNDAKQYQAKAKGLKDAINKHLWMEDRGYYAQYLYGRNYDIISPRSETLGEALTILYDIAPESRQKTILEKTPLEPFGPPIFWPHIPNIPPYHNNSVWPWVSGYWALAAAKGGNEKAVMNAMGSISRAAALFCTNKENFVAQNGDWGGTQINSSSMLWCIAANIAMTHRVLFGIDFEENQLVFKPFVPKTLAAARTLTNFKYRNATLEVGIEGYGNQIKEFYIDGKKSKSHTFPASLSGAHKVRIVMASNSLNSTINVVDNRFSLPTAKADINNGILSWNKVEHAVRYIVLRNGVEYKSQTENSLKLVEQGEYQVMTGARIPLFNSFASEPLIWRPDNVIDVNFTAIKINKKENREMNITVNIPQSGNYSLDWLYANANGTVADENKCAIRTLTVDGQNIGISIFPQRGWHNWGNLGWSNKVKTYLSAGEHTIGLVFLPENENMNIETNEAMLHKLRVMPY